eukprot:4506208-Alexandrium_andersonii.AAC.1
MWPTACCCWLYFNSIPLGPPYHSLAKPSMRVRVSGVGGLRGCTRRLGRRRRQEGATHPSSHWAE